MAIGERIHHFRLLRGFTQKYLGQQLGFSESQADVRIAQYEKGARSPKENYLNALADIFDVSPHALAVPDIDSYVGLMHTLFTLEKLFISCKMIRVIHGFSNNNFNILIQILFKLSR